MADVLSPKAFSKGTEAVYPYFLANNPDESFQMVCRNLEEGGFPLCLNYNGNTYKIMEISLSAYNIHKLLNSISLTVVTKGGRYDIKTMEDYMEGVKIWIC